MSPLPIDTPASRADLEAAVRAYIARGATENAVLGGVITGALLNKYLRTTAYNPAKVYVVVRGQMPYEPAPAVE